MRVKLEDRYKEFYTVNDLESARALIRAAKEDEASAAEWAEYAVREALHDMRDSMREVIKASAHTAKNSRVYNAYGDDSGYMDIWINAIAETDFGFIKVGAYLSDLWQAGNTHFKEHMYIRYYTEH